MPAPTTLQYQSLIIAGLTAADDEQLADLANRVPMFWEIHARKACWPEVRYWYTRRDAIRYMMGCLRSQTDVSTRTGTGVGVGNVSSRSDGTNVGQGTRNLDSYYDSDARKTTDKDLDAAAASNSTSQLVASRNSLHYSSFVDESFGDSARNNRVFSPDRADQRAFRQRTFRTRSNLVDTLRGEAQDEYTDSSQSGYPTGGTPPIDDSYFDDFSLTGGYSVSGIGTGIGLAYGYNNERFGQRVNGDRISRRALERGLNSFHYDIGDASRNFTQVATNNFDARVTWFASLDATRSAVGSSNFAATSSSIGRTNNSGIKAVTRESAQVFQSSHIAERDGEFHRDSTKQDTSVALMEKRQQRFKHLQVMYDNATRTIRWIEARLAALDRYKLVEMIAKYPDGLCDDGGYLFQVTNPYGQRQLPLPMSTTG